MVVVESIAASSGLRVEGVVELYGGFWVLGFFRFREANLSASVSECSESDPSVEMGATRF